MVQKAKPLAGERLEAMKQEVAKLEAAGFIHEVRFQTWVANTMLVKKEQREVENVSRFHRPQQSLSERHVPITPNQSAR